MTAGQAIAFVLFAVVVAITPGPSNLMLTSTGAAVGLLRGIPALLGQVIGVGLMLFVVAFGLGSIVLHSSAVLQGLKWCGIAFLLWLSWKIATAGHAEANIERVHFGFWQAVGFQWVNPKAWLICAGAVGTYFQAAAGTALERSAFMALLFMLAALPSCSIWLAVGAGLQRVLQRNRAARFLNVTMAALLAASIVLFIH